MKLADNRQVMHSQRLLQQTVRSLGTATFDRALFAYLNDIVAFDFLTVFVHRSIDEAPRVAVATSVNDPSWSRRLSAAYLGHFWRIDPATRALIGGCGQNRVALTRTRPLDIDDSEYRQQCYSSAFVRERLSLSTALGPDCVRLNLFRGRGRAHFSDGEIDWLQSQATLMGALSWRHHQIDPAQIAPCRWEPPELERRLSAVSGILSVRERQVGARIAAGWTSDAIAEDLGLSRNSILTFRRRLYAKLGVNSVARLYRLIEGA